MSGDPNGEHKAAESEHGALPVSETAPPPPPVEPVQPLVPPPPAQHEVPAEPQQPPNPSGGRGPTDPLLIRIVGDDDSKKTERDVAVWTRRGVIVAFIALVVACVGGWLVYQQFKEMATQTDLLNIAARQARSDSKDSSIATQKQLRILQNQLSEQRQALEVDQRPWIKLETEGQRTAGIDPNNIKSHFFPTVAGQPLKMEIKATNVGKTTAEDVLGAFIIEVAPKSENRPFFPDKGIMHFYEEGQPMPKGAASRPATAWRQGTLYPQEVAESYFSRLRPGKNGRAEDDPMTQQERTALDSGESYFLNFGEVWYRDVFGIRHWTKFCEMGNAQINVKVAERCLRFNAVDGK